MKKRTRILAALLSAVMVLGMAACGKTNDDAGQGSKQEGTPAAEKVVSIGITNAWGSWNPYGNAGNYCHIISDQIYDRLWVTNNDGTVQPRLAKSYDIAEDHSYMTVHLDETATFTDGEPVTADDVVFSAKLDANPEFNSALRDQLQYIAGTTPGGVCENEEEFGFEKVDDHTVKITFKEPMNELPILTMVNRYLFIVPEHIYGEYTMAEMNESETWKSNMVGSGPFKYETAIDGERVELVKNEDYFLGEADIDRLIIRVVETSQLLSGLMTGELDVTAGAGIGNLPLTDWPAAQKEDYLEAISAQEYSYQCMMVNMSSAKIPNAECRRGINMAIDREGIVNNLLSGEGTVLYAPFSDAHPFVDESKLTNIPKYNPEEAKKLLEEGGFDFNQTLELIVPVGNEVRIQSTVLIQQNLADIGVKVKITQYDFATLMDLMRKGEYDLGMMGSAGGIEPSEPSAFNNNEGAVNFPCVPDDRFISLFNKAKVVLDLEEQKEAYTEVWQKLLDESAICYLYSPNVLLAYNKTKLANLDTDLFSQIGWKVWDWDYLE